MSEKLTTFQRVRELSGWQAVAFAVTLVERMQPNYQLFCESCDFVDPSQFRKTLDSAWEWLAGSKTKINFALQLDKIEQATPDAQDFDNYGVFPAIDAAISLASSLNLIMNEEPQGAVMVSKLSQGCVESFIEAVAEQELSSEEIKLHPLMQWEVAFQNELVTNLASIKSGAEGVKQLKLMATEDGVSNIGIER